MSFTSSSVNVFQDSRGRPLVIIRKTPKGKILYILMRYKDMTEDEKNIVRVAYKTASQRSVDNSDFESLSSDIEDFLNFSENRLCG